MVGVTGLTTLSLRRLAPFFFIKPSTPIRRYGKLLYFQNKGALTTECFIQTVRLSFPIWATLNQYYVGEVTFPPFQR